MLADRRFWLVLSMVFHVGAASAATPGYRLDCLPDGAGAGLEDTLRLRLELHGWRAAQHDADVRLCLRRQERVQTVYDPPLPGDPYYYWNPPAYRQVRIPYLQLSLTRRDGTVWRAEQTLPDDSAVAIEQGTRQLVDRLPAE